MVPVGRGTLAPLALMLLLAAAAGCRGEEIAYADDRQSRSSSSSSQPPAGNVCTPDTEADAACGDAAVEAAAQAPDPENKARPPASSPDLDERAAHLLRAVAEGRPELADDFFFPKPPFIPLKDVANPGKYFDQLLAIYHRDVMELHRKRTSWEGAKFVSFELGSAPTWVAPGHEYNKIGYYRTFRGKLRYQIADTRHTLEVMTIISWDGRWYCTHLAPIRH